MLDGIDIEKDAMGIIRHEDFVCGDCRHVMIPIGGNRYQCPHCGMVFDDSMGDAS
jgi:tRNA(Ile2) C34 agmatinyltransferase TiaS